MAQLCPRAVEAHKDLADGIVLADLVIVQNSYNNLHFLWRGGGEGVDKWGDGTVALCLVIIHSMTLLSGKPDQLFSILAAHRRWMQPV